MLPELPKKIKHKEADFGTKVFKPWVHANASLFKRGCTFELKQTKTNSIPFSCLEEVQIDASLAIKWGAKGYLIRNLTGTIGAPDYSFYNNNPAFIVIRYPSGFVLIDIETFLEEKKRSRRKSLTWERAQEISWKIIKKG